MLAVLIRVTLEQPAVFGAFADPDRLWLARALIEQLNIVGRDHSVHASLHYQDRSGSDFTDRVNWSR